MKYENLIDYKKAKPAKNGKYHLFDNFLKTYIPVSWKDGAFYFKNGDKVPDGAVKYWR